MIPLKQDVNIVTKVAEGYVEETPATAEQKAALFYLAKYLYPEGLDFSKIDPLVKKYNLTHTTGAIQITPEISYVLITEISYDSAKDSYVIAHSLGSTTVLRVWKDHAGFSDDIQRSGTVGKFTFKDDAAEGYFVGNNLVLDTLQLDAFKTMLQGYRTAQLALNSIQTVVETPEQLYSALHRDDFTTMWVAV